MIDISILQQYIVPTDIFYVEMIKHDIQRHGLEYVFNYFLIYLDCSRISKDGLRLQQTIGFRYKYELTHALYFIDTYYNEQDKDNKLQSIIELHKKNLEFEKEHPPIDYTNKQKEIKEKKKKTNNSQTKTKQKDKSAKEIKMEHKINRINALKFNLTLAANGNKTI